MTPDAWLVVAFVSAAFLAAVAIGSSLAITEVWTSLVPVGGPVVAVVARSGPILGLSPPDVDRTHQ